MPKKGSLLNRKLGIIILAALSGALTAAAEAITHHFLNARKKKTPQKKTRKRGDKGS